jgi:predicted amidophosphoribosyltransferase
MRAICCFTHLTGAEGWDDPQYSVKKFVDAIKQRRINGYGWIQVAGKLKRRLEQRNATMAFDWFGEMSADILKNQSLNGRPILVPFPDSKCTVGTARPSKTKLLANAVARHFPADVADILRFDIEMASANTEQGTRDAAEIYGHLQTIAKVAKDRPHVLIDDVLTTGGHLQAGAAELRRCGGDVLLAICGVWAHRYPVEDPFARVELNLEDLEF